MDIRNKVGNRIRELRQQKKISQEALANIAEIDRTYMTSVENGKRNISIINLEKIIKALDIDYSEFFNSQLFKNEKKA
jgi:transcriptional regulator with XRE-family HTH domain